ncbi:hypothetical protein ACIU1J_32180 [Azospirillum doebereinerae]|uniref:hypothetical protein n=1 Tax=Azospirillum doebereinerae TaxID=92933 RepID=UPI001EE5807A|nr:hypothetical protein [Azospirillum doebereinerae]MCG5238400.1 hypothetical protein [Azospirillum doebereinerae]
MTGSAMGVMVVDGGRAYGRDDAGGPAWLAALVKVAEPGLRGDRAGVMEALLGIHRDVQADGGACDPLAALIVGFRQGLDAAADRPSRVADVLTAMHNLGSLTDEELAAGLELRAVAQVLAEVGAVQAVDFGRPMVDGSGSWTMPTGGDALLIVTPQLEKAKRWADWIGREGRTIRSRRGKGGVQASVLALVHRVVFENVPLQELDRELKVRKGTAAQVVKAALALHAGMPIAP